MLQIIFIILIFILGFCFGALSELKNTSKMLKMAKKNNDEWCLLCEKQNKEWSEYCESLIDEIKSLKRKDVE